MRAYLCAHTYTLSLHDALPICLQSLRWFAQSKQPCPLDFARETMELYTPLANRLGIWQIKWEMEDLAFRFLEPDTYKDIARKLEERRVEREGFIKQVVDKRSEEHTSELQSRGHLVCRLLLEIKK